MQPSTSAVQDLATNILEEKDLNEEDAKFLLKALEKQAFEHVLYAFRAQGPLTKYKELVLEHLKSALFITDQEFSLNLRIAANNPYLNEIVQKLNPSYDNFSEWLAAGLDLSGAEMANSRRQQLNNNNSKLVDHSTQILREIRRHNRNLSHESYVASEAIAELYQLPKRPFMPERLRKLLRDTETDGIVEVTEINKKEKSSEVIPQTTTTTKEPETKIIKKRNVGRPRKYPRKEETNIEQPKQQTKEETQQINNNNNINCFIGKMWGKRRPNWWKEPNDTNDEESNFSSISPINSSVFGNKMPEMNNSFKNISFNSLPIDHIVQPSTSRATEAMENLADLALAQMAEFPLISSSTSLSSPLPTSTPTQIYINNLNSSNESLQHPNKLNNQIVQNNCDLVEKNPKILPELASEGASLFNACARARPYVRKLEQQHCVKAENRSNFRSSSSPLPLHISSRYKHDIHPLTTNNSLTKFVSSNSEITKNITVTNDDDHSYERNNSIITIDDFDDYIQIENDEDLLNNQQKQQNGFGNEMNFVPNLIAPPTSSASFSTKIIQNIPVVIEEESGLDFLASTASLLQPIEMNNNNESSGSNNKGNYFNEQNNNKRHSTFTK
ncbi:hypothetical protein ACQ4LE_006363 [Meloidogyne hapla]